MIFSMLSILLSSFVVGLSGAMMPGPLLTVTISESSRRGMMVGTLLILGHGMLELVLVICILFGLAPILNQKRVFITIALAGAAILIWMAVGMFRALPSLSLKGGDNESTRKNNLVIAGAMISVANPYWTIWWVSIGVGYIAYSLTFGKWGVFFFFIGHIMADLLWYAAISAAVWKGKDFLTDKVYRWLIGVCAAFLVVFACGFAWSGIQKLIA